MLVVITGALGKGKTLLLTSFAINSALPVVANYHLKIPGFAILSKYKLIKGDYENMTICIDEAYTLLDARDSMAEQNRLLSYILFQSRKKSVDLLLTVQLGSTLDVRFREMADMVIEAQGLVRKKGEICWKYSRSFNSQNANIYLKFNDMRYLFDLYDTDEVVLADNVEAAERYRSKKEQIEGVNGMAQSIIAAYKGRSVALTKERVKVFMWENNMDKTFLSAVWIKIQDILGG